MSQTPYQSAVPEKPGMVTAIAVMTLVSGIFNILWGVSISLAMLFGIVTIFCIPLTILPAVLGIFEIIYAARLLPATPGPLQPSRTLSILEIVAIISGNVIAVVVGILTLIFYNEPTVQAYFDQLNDQAPYTAPPQQA